MYSYRDSVPVNPATSPLPSDTLGNPGSITGTVALQPNHDPRTALVQIQGTSHFANVDSLGRFRIAPLARGEYSFRVITALPDYTPLHSGFTIRAGGPDSLPDTLKPVFTGIPVVMGLKAA